MFVKSLRTKHPNINLGDWNIFESFENQFLFIQVTWVPVLLNSRCVYFLFVCFFVFIIKKQEKVKIKCLFSSMKIWKNPLKPTSFAENLHTTQRLSTLYQSVYYATQVKKLCTNCDVLGTNGDCILYCQIVASGMHQIILLILMLPLL